MQGMAAARFLCRHEARTVQQRHVAPHQADPAKSFRTGRGRAVHDFRIHQAARSQDRRRTSEGPSGGADLEEWFERLDRGETFSEIADWLNALGIPTGPFCRSERWTCADGGPDHPKPAFKGSRQRNRKESKRYNKTGNTGRSTPGPRICWNATVRTWRSSRRPTTTGLAKVNARNAKYRRNGKDGAEPRSNIPKKRIRYPGQSIRCGVCGRLLVFGAHGQHDHLMCSGAREYRCWNSISLDGPLTAQRVAEMVLAEIETLEDFDAAIPELVNEEARKLDAGREPRLRDMETLIDQRRVKSRTC